MIQVKGTTDMAEVDSSKNLYTRVPGFDQNGVARGGGSANAPAMFGENDNGQATLSRFVLSPEVDDDYRLRAGIEFPVDDENFNYTAQNTGKHQYTNTTLTFGWTAAGMQTNASGITTTTTGAKFTTYAFFPVQGFGQSISIQFHASVNTTPVANSVVDFGLFLPGSSNPYAPTDGVYFRMDSSGVKAVINNNGTEVETLLNGTGGTGNFNLTANKANKYIITLSESYASFWINDILYFRIATPIGQGSPVLSAALPVAIRHAIVGGAAGGNFQVTFKEYSLSLLGVNYNDTLGGRGNAIYGAYQGLSGGTMGGLTVYTNSSNPTAAVPSNTALTANLPNGLGGEAWETFTTGLAANTDGILMSYQVPAGKRLKVTGVKMSAFVQTALTGGGFNSTFALAFGHTAVSLATAETAKTKKPRIVLLPELTQTVASGATALTLISQLNVFASFDQPIYVNPGEFIAFTVKHIGTVATAGVIAYNIQYIYSWE